MSEVTLRGITFHTSGELPKVGSKAPAFTVTKPDLTSLTLAELAGKKVVPQGPGTFPTDGALFAALLVAVVVIVGALTFFPALALGPVVEHFASGRTF